MINHVLMNKFGEGFSHLSFIVQSEIRPRPYLKLVLGHSGRMIAIATGLEAAESPANLTAGKPAIGRSYAVLAVLTLVYAMNMGNRFLLSTITEPVRLEFGLSDSQIGILTGTISALFIVIAGVPFGILADRANRRWLVTICCAIFSLMTAAGGFAKNFLSLAVSRTGVGIGAGGSTPASLSIVSDLFPPAKRGVAMTIFTLGISLGATIGTGLVGWLTDHYGWRVAMTGFGLAGLPVAALVLIIVSEPRRGGIDNEMSGVEAQIQGSFLDTLYFVWAERALFHVIAGAMVVTMWTWGLILWLPPLMGRKFGMTAGEVGAVLSPIHLFGGIGSILLTTLVMRWLSAKPLSWQLTFVGLCVAVGTVPSIIAFKTPVFGLCVAMLWIYIPVGYLYNGPVFALVSDLAPAVMRGQAISIMSLTSTLGDLVIMPPLLGLVSDIAKVHFKDPALALETSVLIFALTGFWGAYHFFAAATHLRKREARRGARLDVLP